MTCLTSTPRFWITVRIQHRKCLQILNNDIFRHSQYNIASYLENIMQIKNVCNFRGLKYRGSGIFCCQFNWFKPISGVVSRKAAAAKYHAGLDCLDGEQHGIRLATAMHLIAAIGCDVIAAISRFAVSCIGEFVRKLHSVAPLC